MITIACVLKSGGDYDLNYVKALADGVRSHTDVPYRMICLTDHMDSAEWLDICSPVGLVCNWPGWWSKIELFKIKPPVLYFDLDTVIVGDITPLASWVSNECEGLLMLKGFYKQDRCSGIMGWRQDMSIIFERFRNHYASKAEFVSRPNGLTMRLNGNRYRGDQEWVSMVTQKEQTPVTFVQDVFHGVYSYKVNIANKKTPDDASVICFHGRPRPHEVELDRVVQ